MTSFEKVIDLFQTSSFKEGFEEYKSKNTKTINEITEFLDSIETNKKYYRIGIQKNKKYRKKQNEDTEDIKNINSLVNKITENNFEVIYPDAKLCGDNAAMIAMVGLEKFKINQFDKLDLQATPRLPLDINAKFLKGAGVKL